MPLQLSKPQPAQPDFIPAGPDFIPADGGAATPPAKPQEGFIHSLATSLGANPDAPAPSAKEAVTSGLSNALLGPVGALKGLYQGAKRSAGEVVDAGKSLASGNKPEAAVHAIKAVPFVGPALDKASDQYADKDFGGEAGTLTGAALQTAPIMEGGLRAVGEEPHFIPSKARASNMFSSIEKHASNVPVSMARTQPALDEFGQSVKTGGKSAPVMTKLANRISPPSPKPGNMLTQMQNNLNGTPTTPTMPSPVNFPEARDFYTNISRATAKPGFLRRAIENPGAPAFRMNAGNVREALNSDLTNAAQTIGRGEDYSNAMNEYRRASQLNKGLKTAAKIGVGGAVAGMGGSPIMRFIRESQ